MSTLKVEIVEIESVEPHPNADRLDLVQVRGWRCVAGRKDPAVPLYKKGDRVLYIPIDSVLPPDLEEFLFPADGAIHLTKSRIRTIKLRGAISQGLVVDLTPELAKFCSTKSPIYNLPVGTDVTEAMRITKYEPPEEEDSLPSGFGRVKREKKAVDNPLFQEYTKIQHLKDHYTRFAVGEPVSITEKLHGTSARYAKLPTFANTWWKKILKFFRLLPKVEFCYGSHRRQLQDRFNKKSFYPTDVWGKVAKALRLADVLGDGEALYGEIVGSGIQTGYTYGCAEGERKFFAFDVMIDGKYLDPADFRAYCAIKNIPTVPLLYEGEFHHGVADLLRKGDSTIGGQKVREGIVVKSQKEHTDHFGRKALKLINDEYYLKEQTEFH